ncbi:MAG: glutathione-dependent formaldehyde-activating protein [Ideonella sp. MAG2]|nr:MAG: glutathione-dependent formaldehyde-activating protein [Ideonella sp. MAG2]
MKLPATPPPWSGACLCGQVQFELTALPITFYACHCTDCQRRTGGAMRLVMWVELSALRLTRGQAKLITFQISEHKQRRAMACAECDTRLWALPTDRPSMAGLFPGTLHKAREFEPVAHLWTRSAPSWVQIPPGATVYEAQPSRPGELTKLWQDAIQDHAFNIEADPSA